MPIAQPSPTRTLAGALFIIVATFAAYLPAIRGGFIWDDDAHVTQNATLRSLAGLKLIWTAIGATPQYYPMTHTSFWVEYGIWGTRPLGYHVTNVALHVTSALLLWRILRMLGVRAAWLAAAVFALHPIEVESVAWVTERKNVLAGAFYFGAMLAYLRACDAGSGTDSGAASGAALRGLRSAPAWGGYLLSLGLFVCAVLSKTIAGTLPAALLLIMWWKVGAIPRRHVLLLLPMFAVAIAFGSLTGWMERTHVGATGPEWGFTFVERCLIAGRAVWHYVLKLVAPVNLTFVYPRWDVDPRAWWQYLFPLTVVAVVAALFVLRRRTGRGPLVAVLYFVGTLFPALGFANVYPMRYSFVADHFQYLAGVGLIVLIAEVLSRRVRAGGPLLIALPVALGVLTWLQCHTYHDERTLWEATLQRNPHAWIAHDHLGAILRGSDPATAAGHFAEAIRLNPKHVEGYIGLATVLAQAGDVNGAVAQLQKAIDARPDKPLPYHELGNVLAAAGDLEGAARAYERAVAVSPDFLWSRVRLVELYTRLGRGDDAARHRAAVEQRRQEVRELLGR